MPPPSPQRKRKQKLLGNHQRCWIWGRNTVLETLRAGRWPILELHVAESLPRKQFQQARQLAAQHGVSVSIEPVDALTRRCRTDEHQGYAAKMPPFPYDDAEQVLAGCRETALLAILDSIQDPHNFGAIIRTAEVLGVDALFVKKRGQCEVTSLVARSSAGAVNHVQLAQVASLAELARRLKESGVQLVAALQTGRLKLFDCDFRQPTAVVIGNEATGIDAELLQLCNIAVNIPQYGDVDSLNAAVAAGIVFYEARRQRALQP